MQKTTLTVAPLKRKFIQEVLLPGPSIKQIITSTGPVQKTYLQNVDRTSQELPISTMASSWAEVATEQTTAEETGVSDEAQLVSRAFVSGESGEATTDRGSRSTPELPMKKRQ